MIKKIIYIIFKKDYNTVKVENFMGELFAWNQLIF